MPNNNQPSCIFYRYDMLIKRSIELIYLSNYVKITGVRPVDAARITIQDKQNAVGLLIDNCELKVDYKVRELKTIRSRENAISKFESSFIDFYDEMDESNILKVTQAAEKMRRKYCQK